MRRVAIDEPGFRQVKPHKSRKQKATPSRLRAKAERLAVRAAENAKALEEARDLRRESWADKTRNRQDETILTSEQDRRELRAEVRREVAGNGEAADATEAAKALHIAATPVEGEPFYGKTSKAGKK